MPWMAPRWPQGWVICFAKSLGNGKNDERLTLSYQAPVDSWLSSYSEHKDLSPGDKGNKVH